MCDLPELAALTSANFYFVALAFVSAFFWFVFGSASFKKDIADLLIHIHAALVWGCIFTPFHAPCSFSLARRTRTQAELERMTRVIC